ncbi:MAG: hypothetical protein K2Y56_07710 [Methylobacterium sp.]|uniref:hypothetical protein n=1 Tax=Methylobacterium sp. TaxID=409 RepID=UPI0025F205AA|nr:hypothetical protein [Methylobacterium sp.]MBX9931410.1 hypothetical protein [Methylobacterium sp.]
MWLPSQHRREIDSLRHELAALNVEAKLLRLGQSLNLKYDPDQPRASAGQSNGGQWISEDGGGRSIDRPDRDSGQWASPNGEADRIVPATERTVTDDGSVLSIRISAGRRDWDEQHTVVLPDGESRVFETSGTTQTIRDGESGEVLSRSTFTISGIEPEAAVQSAFLPALAPATPAVVSTTIEALALLFTVLSARKDGFGTVLGMTAQQYDFEPSADKDFRLAWVGRIDQAALDAACPRNAEVQAVTDEAYARLTALNPLLTGNRLGNLLHFDVAGTFKFQNDPNMIPELSLDANGDEVTYGRKGSVRLDLFERTPVKTVCVYDYKTGNAEFGAIRALFLARRAKFHYPDAKSIIMVQVKPNKPKMRINK